MNNIFQKKKSYFFIYVNPFENGIQLLTFLFSHDWLEVIKEANHYLSLDFTCTFLMMIYNDITASDLGINTNTVCSIRLLHQVMMIRASEVEVNAQSFNPMFGRARIQIAFFIADKYCQHDPRFPQLTIHFLGDSWFSHQNENEKPC